MSNFPQVLASEKKAINFGECQHKIMLVMNKWKNKQKQRCKTFGVPNCGISFGFVKTILQLILN